MNVLISYAEKSGAELALYHASIMMLLTTFPIRPDTSKVMVKYSAIDFLASYTCLLLCLVPRCHKCKLVE